MNNCATAAEENTNYSEQDLTCSRKGCCNIAQWQIRWNNPKIHSPQRLKTWLSCEEHKLWLENYLKLRNMWRVTIPVSATVETSSSQTPGSPDQ